MTKGKVFLLGAGPGDPELITARALRHLRKADVVLYDALVHKDLLAACKDSAELIFVGKRAGRQSERQASINDQLVKEARAGKKVARLKGGDPYLFGRGSEEAEHLAKAGIEFEVVPGIPSPIAATVYSGISLTHRDLASSVAYVTATESPDKDRSSHDWARLATATQTLVIFMGMRKLDSLMRLLVEHGRPEDTPVAVVQWASLPRQKTVVGTLSDIAERVQAENLERPAITIVGEVVTLREHLRWFDTQPLFSKRVLITRPMHQAGVLAQRLRDEGAEPVAIPSIRLEDPPDVDAFRAAVKNAHAYDWLLFTSQNTVHRFFDRLKALGKDTRSLKGPTVAAIGQKTAAALRENGLIADHVTKNAHAEGLLSAIDSNMADKHARILLPRALHAREVLPETLRNAGHLVDVVAAYQTVAPSDEDKTRLLDTLQTNSIDAALFTSGSSVDQLCDLLEPEAQSILNGLTIAAIGKVTAAALEARQLNAEIVAEEATIESLVEGLRAYYDKVEP